MDKEIIQECNGIKVRRGSVRLEIGNTKDGEAAKGAGASRFGGAPDVPEGFVWPTFETDTYDDSEVKPRPLAFFAQLDLGEVAAFDREGLLPGRGVLSFFYEMDSMRWGYDPKDKGCARVFWFEDKESLKPAEFPDDLAEDFRFPVMPIGMRTEDSWPGQEDFALLDPSGEKSHEERYQEIRGGWEESTGNVSKLLGWPDVIQNNMTVECELVSRGHYLGGMWETVSEEEKAEAQATSLEGWRLLFQLDEVTQGDFDLMFGDCGRIYFYIRTEDLAARRFDDVWLVLQCF